MAATATANQAILNRLQSFQRIHPATANLFADWTLEPGDIVTVQSGEDSFSVPVYQMNLEWRGDSTVQVQSTGSEKRPPLSELKRRSYASGRRQETQEQELIRHQADIEKSNERILLWATEDEWNEILQYWQQTGKSQFEVTATEIASKVSNSTYQSYVSQTANKIALVVGGTDANPTVNTAGILLAINGDGTTSAGINADKIFLVGNTTLAGQLTVQDGALRVKTALLVSGSTNGNVSVNNGTVSAYEHQVNMNGRVRFVGSGTGERYDLTASVVSGLISSLSLTGPVNNEYTLSWTTVGNSTPQTKNFSRATTLAGAWDSGVYTVSASPQGNEDSTRLSDIAPVTTRNGNVYTVDWDVGYGELVSGEWRRAGSTGLTGQITVDASDVWQDGYDAGGGGQVVTPVISTTWGSGAQTGRLAISSTPTPSNPTEYWFSSGAISWTGNIGTIPVTTAPSQHGTATTRFNLEVDATARYTAGETAGETAALASIHHVGLDSGKNHIGSYWNCVVYDAENNVLKTVNTNGSSSGLYFPIAGKRITENGTYTAVSDSSISGIAAYSQVVVDVPQSGSSSVSDISLNDSIYWISSSSGTSPQGYSLGSTSTLIAQHKNDRGYIQFSAKLNGVSGTKWYYITIG